MRSVKHIFSFVAVSLVLLLAGRISKVHLWQAWVDRLPESEVRNSQELDHSVLQAGQTAILRISRLQTAPKLLTAVLSNAISSLLPEVPALPVVRMAIPSPLRLVTRRDFLFAAPPMAP